MDRSIKSKLGIGVIGTGPMGMHHLKGIRVHPRLELKAVCDINIESACAAAKEYGISSYYSDYRELIARSDIDLVIIATPDHFHSEQTIAALREGKHVLCEKPMALTLDECRAMIAESERTGKKLMIGQISRYAPSFVLVKKLIEEGYIGEMFFVESEYAHDYSELAGVGNWRKDPIILRQPFLGGGCHSVDLLRWIAGDPYEVAAYSNRKVLKDWPVDDCTIAIMRFPNDVIGKVLVSVGCKRNYTMRSVFYGDKGTIIADNTSSYITVYKESIAGEKSLFEGVQQQTVGMQIPVEPNHHNAFGEINDFVNIILNDLPVQTDGRQGAATVAACLAAVESAAKGEKVVVNYDF
ncbi:MAG TPA: Gfo/Idh/MocA family oxidoreductase [Clostridiaceae bacterium]|nr:Gfo/Idh/MocA family oxidoreductase [Clostridiaceae bacterium]